MRRILIFVVFLYSLYLAAQTPSDFSVVLLPDTQYYSESHPTIFQQQTQWIVNNRTAWNIQAVLGEGDIVNTPGNAYEWTNADQAIQALDVADIPYALAIGNHDYDNIAPTTRSTVAYNNMFGVARYASKTWYGGHYGTTNESFYITFTTNGQKYIVLALEYYPRTLILDWANDLMTNNPDAIFLITTHAFEYTDGAREDVCDTNDMRNSGQNAESVWESVLKEHPNVQLVVSGHVIGNNTAHRTDVGLNGNLVHQIFTNFQNLTNGGNGYLRILKFRPSLNTIEVYTYSPSLNQWLTTAAFQFVLPISNVGNTATTGALEGKVRLPNCTKIAGAIVTAGTLSAVTNSNGYYKISGLTPSDLQSLSVTAPGYFSQTSSNPVYAGYATQTNFYLAPSAQMTCPLSTVDPSVTICSPTPNATVTSPVHINGGANASIGTKLIQIFVDGKSQGMANANTIDSTLAMATGTRRITLQAQLNDNSLVKNTIYVTVGTAQTSGVTMTSPVNGSTVANPVAVKATASSTVAISFIELWVDGVKKLQVTGNTMNTTVTLSSGSHRITTQAKDANGIYYKASATITVQ
jgi:hypothetical protein